MTRKDFKLIAETIKNLDRLDTGDSRYVAEEFAKTLRQTNPRFDAQIFLKACGV